MYKIALLTLIIIFCQSLGQSQYGYNKSFDFEMVGSKGTSLLIDGERIFLLTLGFVNEPYNSMGIGIAEINVLDGKLIDFCYYEEDQTLFFTETARSLYKENNELIGILIESPGNIEIWSYDLQIKNYLVLDSLANIIDPAQSFIPGTLIYTDKSNFVYSGSFGTQKNESIPFICGMNESEKFCYNHYSTKEFTVSMNTDYLGHFYLFSTNNYHKQESDPNYFATTSIYKVNLEGEVLWYYSTPEELSIWFTQSSIIEKNGDIVFTGAIVISVNGELRSRPVVAKINQNKELVWINQFGNHTWDKDLISGYKKILKSSSGGYIVAGESRYISEADTLSHHGVIGEMSYEGDSVWYKEYSKIDGIHSINDIEPYKGGYIACGWVMYFTRPSHTDSWLQTWLIKTDSLGNIVEDPSLSIQEEFFQNVIVSPNPSKDKFIINGLEQFGSHSTFITIYDCYGRMISKDIITHADYNFDLSGYNSGLYLLQLKTKKGESKTFKNLNTS